MHLLLLAFAASAGPVTIEQKNDLLDFSYSWSAEAAAVPALDRRFRADASSDRRKATKAAEEDRTARRKTGGDWNEHYLESNWQTAGQSSRLLSLEAETGAYTGGAHPVSGTTSLLWGRRLGREVTLDALLQRSGWWNGAVRQPFCVLLDRERTERRQAPVKRSDLFGNCPKLQELTLTLEDQNRNGRFDHVRITADQYVAGPYAEGPYVISLPITATMITRLKPEYRSSFEAQPPVQ
jgi:hypothetical protein